MQGSFPTRKGGVNPTTPDFIDASPVWATPPRHLMWWLVGLLPLAIGAILAFPAPLTPVVLQLPEYVLGAFLLWRLAGTHWKEPAIWFFLSMVSATAGVLFLVLYVATAYGTYLTLLTIFFVGQRLLPIPGLLFLGMKRRPKIALGYWLALLSVTAGAIFFALTSIPSQFLPLLWSVSALLVLGFAMPHLESVLHGEAPSARLFWILGWQLLWMAGVLELLVRHNMVAAASHIVLSIPYQTMYLLSSCFLVLGYYGECQRWDMGLWPHVLGTGAVLLSWAVGLLDYRTLPATLFWAWLGLAGHGWAWGHSPS